MAAPLLELDRARIDSGGAAAIDGLTLSTTGDKVLVLGAARALFEAAAGMRAVSHGALRVRGVDATAALAAAEIAGAPFDPPLPPEWTPRLYCTWSARLAGQPKKTARAMADEALARLRMEPVARAPLGRAAPNVRRATVIAAAVATGAKTILLDDPLGALPDEQARPLARLIASALEDRGWIFFTGRAPLSSPIALHADEAIVIDGAEVAAQGAPAELAAKERAFAVRLHGDAPAFARLARARGAEVREIAPREVAVDLGESMTTRDLLAIAEEARAVILELSPLARAFQ